MSDNELGVKDVIQASIRLCKRMIEHIDKRIIEANTGTAVAILLREKVSFETRLKLLEKELEELEQEWFHVQRHIAC